MDRVFLPCANVGCSSPLAVSAVVLGEVLTAAPVWHLTSLHRALKVPSLRATINIAVADVVHVQYNGQPIQFNEVRTSDQPVTFLLARQPGTSDIILHRVVQHPVLAI